jgi:hypothetical protein
MKEVCIAAVSKAAGRVITLDEQQHIESRVKAALRVLAMQNPDGFRSKSADVRMMEAAKLAAKWLDQDALDEQRRLTTATAVHDRVARQVAQMEAAGHDPQDAMDRLLYNNADNRSTVQSLESRIAATNEDYQRQLMHTMEAVSPKFFGLMADIKGSGDFVRELFGTDTRNPIAKEAAKEWRSLASSMAKHFEDAGGVLHRLADWRYPQMHDQVKVFNAGLQKWLADVVDKIDRTRYTNENGLLMNDVEIRHALAEAWDSISTGGANDIEPGKREGVSKVANRELAHRYLHFKDAQGYLDYQTQYGQRDVWSTLTGHVQHMARSIGLMEHFGPNADREFAFWNDRSVKEARANKPNAIAVGNKLENAYRQLAGYSEGVANSAVAKAFDDLRNVNVFGKLGSATIASIPDVATVAMTARYNKLSAVAALWNGLRLLNPLAGESRRQLERAGLMANSAIQSMRRFQVDSVGQSWSARMANAVLMASGLNHWTDGMRAGYVAVHAHALAHLTHTYDRLADIGPEDARVLKGKGVTDTDFAVWKLAGGEKTNFGSLLTPDSIYRVPDAALAELARQASDAARPPDALPGTGPTITPMQLRREAAIRLLGVTMSEANMAVSEPGARERAQMSKMFTYLPRGDIAGELTRSFWQFKTFSWGFVQKHMVQRGFAGSDTVGGRVRYIVPLIVGTTIMGALKVELDDLLRGRDARPMYGENGKILTKNWIQAFLAGGGLGMYGDFLGAAATEDSKSALASLMGPTASTIYDAANLAVGSSVKALNDEPQKPLQKALQLAKGMIPGANLWYTKAATDHLIFNWLQEQINPGYLARSEARARTNYGTNYWWSPRQASPSRGPNLTAIAGRQ